MSIMSGKFPARLENPGKKSILPAKENSIAEAFKENGYRTFFTGKWHLGKKKGEYPQDHGFDINKGGGANGMPATYFFPYAKSEDPKKNPYAVRGLENGQEGEFLTDRLIDETISFIKENKSNSFFAFVSLYAVHEPIEAKAELVEKFEKKLATQAPTIMEPFVKVGVNYFDAIQDNPTYAALLETVDSNFGRLLKTLREEGLEENTIIVLTSDNGGLGNNIWSKTAKNLATSNLPLRAGKSYMHEGGIRVPLIVNVPGFSRAGMRTKYLTTGADHYKTLLELCGLPFLKQQHLDSHSYKKALQKEDHRRKSDIFWNYPTKEEKRKKGVYCSRAIRRGDYKLIEFWKLNKIELYNLTDDLEEKNDLSESMPEKTQELKAALHQWVVEVQAPINYYGK